MQTFPSGRRRGRRLVIILILTAAGFPACRRADLPEQGSPKYLSAVRAFYVGLSALQVGDDVRAEEKLKEATALAPDEPASWADLGLLYMRQRRFDEAAQSLDKARQLAPENAGLYLLLGQLESARGNSTEAANHFRRASELDPRNLKALYALGREVERGGEGGEEEELRLLQKILEVQPGNLSVRLDVARLAAKRGDAELFNRLMSGFEKDSAAWPAEAQEQLKAVQSAAASGNTRAAAPRVQFLRNVLVRLPEYRQSRLAVEDPPETLSEPFTRFVTMASPSPKPAPPDDALAFDAAPAQEFAGGAWAWGGAVSLAGEGAPALAFADGRTLQLAGGVKLAFPGGASALAPSPNGVAALDFNYDFKTDLALAGEGGFRLYRQENPTTFVDVTGQTKVPANVTDAPYTGAWAADIEADGDLDIVLASKDGAAVVLRNNGDGTFAEQHPFEGVSAPRDFAWADLDGDGDPDAALLDAQGKLFVFTNERTGQFRARAAPQNLSAIALGVADVNSDGQFDLLLLGSDGALRRLSDKGEGSDWDSAEVVRLEGAPQGMTAGAAKLTAADLDNNGGIDLLVSASAGARAWLSDADGKLKPLKLPEGLAQARSVSVADADADGKLDLVGAGRDGGAFVAKSRGSKNYHWQLIRPRAANATGDQRINSFGVGGEMEIRAGLLVQKQLVTGPLVHFGLGDQTGADVVRVVWPNGSVRAEFELKADTAVLAEQRLKGSCPSLFAFDGERMRFVKDCAPWSPAIGLRINNYQTLRVGQTEEWVKIRGDQLVPHDGLYDLRITAELWETFYLDRYRFAVVDHPAGTEVFVDERTARQPPALKVYTTSEPHAFAGAWDDAGKDVGEVVNKLDGRHLDTFGRGAYQGVTREHFVELELGDEAPREGPLWLVAHGWLHPTDASINVAISQGSRPPPKGLSLEVADGRGGWAVAKPDLGFPSGKNKTILVDLQNVFKPNAPRRLRLRTNMEVYWDALLWAAGADGGQTKVVSLAPASAELRFRGFSEMRSADGSAPETPDYDRLASTGQRWRDLVGYYTRFGDVRELLAETDDRVVIANAGDELLLRFSEQPAPPSGWARDYVLIGNGWIKDGDYNSEFSKTVLPLPSRDREYYTTPPTRLEDDPVYRRHPQDWQNFHTRYVTPEVFEGGLRAR
ncbi:MAG TPA: FG-GAP-like repeat-containing protein [Pyrinomonadaceae bacterium]|nr:FG-GAP-like repeat-containing protein [Pyrinomonadaceae bacterium]